MVYWCSDSFLMKLLPPCPGTRPAIQTTPCIPGNLLAMHPPKRASVDCFNAENSPNWVSRAGQTKKHQLDCCSRTCTLPISLPRRQRLASGAQATRFSEPVIGFSSKLFLGMDRGTFGVSSNPPVIFSPSLGSGFTRKTSHTMDGGLVLVANPS